MIPSVIEIDSSLSRVFWLTFARLLPGPGSELTSGVPEGKWVE